MGLGQSALVMGAEGISSSEISMSSPEDCWPCGESMEGAVRKSLGGSQRPTLNTRQLEKKPSARLVSNMNFAILILVPSLPGHVALASHLTSLSLSFPICIMDGHYSTCLIQLS